METSSAQERRLIRFGVFELDVLTAELRRSGVRVTLQDQPLKVLESLLERPGMLVTRQELRTRLWAGDTFVDFEQGLNAAVRRLRDALGDSAETPRFVETLPRRGYRFIAPVEKVGAWPDSDVPAPGNDKNQNGGAVVDVPHPTRRGGASGLRSALITAGVVVLVLTTIIMSLHRAGAVNERPMHVVPLTTLAGSEFGPTFSPDGNQVAFAWDGEEQDNSDIYVKLVGSSEIRRLTTDPANDVAPQWSPDGKWIAYARRVSRTSYQVRLMSSLGGSERGLENFPIHPSASWSPDGRYLVAGRAPEDGSSNRSSGIYLIPADLGQPRQMTPTAVPASDRWPAFSPDGRHVAYAACRDILYNSDCHIQVQDLDRSLTPIGSPRRLTRNNVWKVEGVAWSRDGQFIIYAARESALFYLWRIGADGQHPPVRVELAGMDVLHPATTPSSDRLAFSKSVEDVELYRLETGGVAHPIARSSLRDTFAQISPDGQRVAFCSARSGDAFEVWVAGSDGSKPERLTRGPGRWQCTPTWSPDGKRIAFDSRAEDGSWHIWTIDANGGALQQITNVPDDQVRPTWSGDGRWIYFLRRRGTERDIWRTRGSNGPYERVTHGGSPTRAWESPDGAGVFYQPLQFESPVYFQALAGGAPRQVVGCIEGEMFAVGRHDIYYVPCQSPGSVDRHTPVHALNLVTGHDRRIATLQDVEYRAWNRNYGCFTVSRDGKTIIYSRLASSGADLMLIENFK
jgi:Tol biopolymer transport system component/DNA-binding winged helix-turn-helix (wHTH) protein